MVLPYLHTAAGLGAEGIVSRRVDGASIGAVPGLGEGSQSRKHCGSAGAQWEVE